MGGGDYLQRADKVVAERVKSLKSGALRAFGSRGWKLIRLQFISEDLRLLPQRTSTWLVQLAAAPKDKRRSIPASAVFYIGRWNWFLHISLGGITLGVLGGSARGVLSKPKYSVLPPKFASFTIRFLVRGSNCPIHTETANDHSFYCHYYKSFGDIRVPIEGFIVEVEFYNLKASSSDDKEPRSIWTLATATFIDDSQTLKACVTRMLNEELHTDVTITTSDSGVVRAHRAILAARSTVFDKMFTHNMREKLSSTISMMDMTSNECRAFLSYMYGNLQRKDLEEHAGALLKAAGKYDMADLKEICLAYMMEGINTNNVLSRLRVASDHDLHDLKQECKCYLLDCGKIWEIKEEVSEFIRESNRQADDELGVELVKELITRLPLAAFQGLPFDGSESPECPSKRRA